MGKRQIVGRVVHKSVSALSLCCGFVIKVTALVGGEAGVACHRGARGTSHMIFAQLAE